MSSKNNWFTTNLAERSSSNLCDFQITLNSYDYDKLSSFEDNCRRCVYEIYDTYDNLYVSYSGGIDSEFVLKQFNDLRLKVTPILVDTPFNQTEIQYAYKYCHDNSVDPIVLKFTKNEFIDLLKQKTIDKGYYALLGGIPLICCDVANSLNGKLLTGYGDPFSVIAGSNESCKMSSILEFSEWDYYLDSYDNSHPSGFLTYDIGVLTSFIKEISYTTDVQSAKTDMYKVSSRLKTPWHSEFYHIFKEIKLPINKYSLLFDKDKLLNTL